MMSLKGAKILFSGSGSLHQNLTGFFTGQLDFSGEGNFDARPGGFGVIFDGAGTLELSATKFLTSAVTFAGTSIFEATISEINKYQYLNYIGPVEPGDIIVIDTERKTITRNSANFLFFFSGDFFNLIPGENIIQYRDSIVSRQLNLEISYRKRYV